MTAMSNDDNLKKNCIEIKCCYKGSNFYDKLKLDNF